MNIAQRVRAFFSEVLNFPAPVLAALDSPSRVPPMPAAPAPDGATLAGSEPVDVAQLHAIAQAACHVRKAQTDGKFARARGGIKKLRDELDKLTAKFEGIELPAPAAAAPAEPASGATAPASSGAGGE